MGPSQIDRAADAIAANVDSTDDVRDVMTELTEKLVERMEG